MVVALKEDLVGVQVVDQVGVVGKDLVQDLVQTQVHTLGTNEASSSFGSTDVMCLGNE